MLKSTLSFNSIYYHFHPLKENNSYYRFRTRSVQLGLLLEMSKSGAVYIDDTMYNTLWS